MSASIELCAVNIAKTSQAICNGLNIFFFIVISFMFFLLSSVSVMVISRLQGAAGLWQPDIQRQLDILFIFSPQ
jgi:hypothetical protein